MSVQMPPEPPDDALVIVTTDRPDGSWFVVDAFHRNEDMRFGTDRWYQIASAKAYAWQTIWAENMRQGRRVLVVTDYTDVWSYNGMEPPK